jgi:GDPmannose 4,6-dehydratase
VEAEMAKTALITGITGQDGSYLAEFLLDKGYQVYGLVRRLSSPNFSRIAHIANRITLLEGDLTDQSSLGAALQTAQPDEVYNLAAQSFVATSWNQPSLTGDVTGLGAVRLFEAVRQFCKEAKVYQASSSEMFGATEESPQNENTKFHPRSPYACAKVYAYHMAINYRASYGMFVGNGILFNHESPRRGIEFVSRKITDGVARIYHGLTNELRLGNLDARRDWGYAGDYAKAMWLMLQQEKPDDYVIATGQSHSVKELAELAFKEVGLNWEDYVVVDPRFHRPADVEHLCGDASKARQGLGWRPEVTFEQLVSMMVKADWERVKESISRAKTL